MRHQLALIALALAACSRAGPVAALQAVAPARDGTAPPTPSPYFTNTCPIPPGVEGYAVVARAGDGPFGDTLYLKRVAQRVAGAWRPPGSSGSAHWEPPAGQLRERKHVLPHELELWDQWTPGAADTATVAVTVRRDGSITNPRLISRSPNPAFTRSLERLADRRPAEWLKRGCRGRECPGRLPAGAPGDTLAVILHFGGRPGPGEPAVRWAANGHHVLPLPGNPFPRYPESLRNEGVSGEVVVGFDVDSTGRADMSTLEVLYDSHPLFAWAVQDVLPRMRYQPAVVNCRRVAWSVQQAFRFSLR